MAQKCKTCGGECSEIGYGKYKCSWCGHEYSTQDFLSDSSNASDLEIFSLLNKARLAIELEYDFKKSLKYSQSVLEKYPENQEANWLALLATNQVIYIQNDNGKYVPTFLEPESARLTNGKYYNALNDRYKLDAEAVEEVRTAAVAEFKKVKPYDVFISYKQHDGNSSLETDEAVWARDIYTELKTNPKTRHLNVFFDQKCLSGANVGWEPHIYSAIKSSKCMILLGSSLDNINSRWVKNEWKRFIAFKSRGDKKDFIVLGSNNVNPLLLDEKLQEKQMITNTSGRWLNEIVARVSEICGKPKKEEPVFEYVVPKKKPKKKKRIGKKGIIALVISLVLVLGGSGLGVGLWYRSSMLEVKATEELISYIPDYEIHDYSQYEDLIDDALKSYNALSDWQKEKVDNRDLLLNAVSGFNNYRIETLRSSMNDISVQTVATNDALEKTTSLYGKLTSEQRAMLSSEEIYSLEQYVKVFDVVSSLSGIQEDVLGRYDEVDSVKRTYLTIDPTYQELVYNYSLVGSFAEQVAYYSNFTFAEVAGGYSIALADGKTLSGEVELPSKYRGQNVVEIPEAAFVDCRGITSLTVPNTVLTIGKGAFQGCNNIESITLPFIGKSETAGQTEQTGYEAVFGWIFGYNGKYTSLISGAASKGFLNKQVDTSDNSICQYIYVPSNESYNHSEYQYFFYIPTSLRTIAITKQTDIPLAAYNGCRMINAVSYEREVNSINDCAFQNCVSLEKFDSQSNGVVNLSGNIESVGNYAFSGCQSIVSIVIPDNIHVFGNHSFDGCRKVSELKLTNKVTRIGDYAFQGLNLLTDITVHESTTMIGKGAFQGCSNLESITLPFVGKSEAAGQSEQTGYETVFGWVFGYNEKYTSLISGAASKGFLNKQVDTSDNSICQYIYVPTNEKYNHAEYQYFFYIPTSLRIVTITKQVDIPLAAFNRCSMLTSITYTNTIQTIGDYAFQNCVSPNN